MACLVPKEEVKEEYIEPVFNKEAKEEDMAKLEMIKWNIPHDLKIAYYSGFLSLQITLVSEWLVLKEEVKEEYIEPVFNKEAKEED